MAKYDVGDILFYKDRFGILFITIIDIDISKKVYKTSTSRGYIDDGLEVPYPFHLIHDSDNIRLATKAEKLLYGKV